MRSNSFKLDEIPLLLMPKLLVIQAILGSISITLMPLCFNISEGVEMGHWLEIC